MKFYTLSIIHYSHSMQHISVTISTLAYYMERVDVKNLFIGIQRPVVTGTCFIIFFISLNTCKNFILLVVWFFLWNKSVWLHVSYRSILVYTYRIKLEAPNFPIYIDGMQRTHWEAYLMTFLLEYKMIMIYIFLIEVCITYILFTAKTCLKQAVA